MYSLSVSAIFGVELAYVVNGDDNNVSIINTSTNMVVGSVTVGNNPRGIAFTTTQPRVSGECLKNTFLTQTERLVVLNWVSFGDAVVNYSIFRNGELIAIISATEPREYTDHSREKNRTYFYEVVANNEMGVISTGNVTVSCK